MKLGKLPARKDAVKFKLSSYGAQLPKPPTKVKHLDLLSDWQGVMGNDQLGDCVCAEAGHGTIFYNALAKTQVVITTDNVIQMYSAVAGYVPGDSSTDNGTDMQVAASWRRKTGIADKAGKRHQIAAYLALSSKGATLEEQVKQSIYYFGAAGIGFEFPAYAMDQFNQGKSWHIQSANSGIDGGHDVLAVAYDSTYLYVVTWGRVQKMTWGFLKKYTDEALAYLSPEALLKGKSIDGFDVAQLQADLAALGGSSASQNLAAGLPQMPS